MEDVIVLTRMYVGKYLEENIGHEVINLFRSDNGNNYIYVNDDGRINPKYNNKIRAVLLVRHVENGVMEVIAKAEQLHQVLYKTGKVEEESFEQQSYIDANKVYYGGVPLYKVYNQNAAEMISITFETKKLRLVKESLYLIEDESKLDNYENKVLLSQKHFSKQSLKMYYAKNEFEKDYEKLDRILLDDSLWETDNTTKSLDINNYGKELYRSGFLSIIRKENDELVFSNLLVHFFKENRSVFRRFANEVLGIPCVKKEFIIRREHEHIDLWIEDEKNIIVIENKIKSKINGERHDIYGKEMQSQLERYYEYAKTKAEGRNVYCFVLTPDYNQINLSKYESGKYFVIINYSRIYEFYKRFAGDMLHSDYFREFIDALAMHARTVDNSNYIIMRDRFVERIRMLLEKET